MGVGWTDLRRQQSYLSNGPGGPDYSPEWGKPLMDVLLAIYTSKSCCDK